jgi:hypothetical protein
LTPTLPIGSNLAHQGRTVTSRFLVRHTGNPSLNKANCLPLERALEVENANTPLTQLDEIRERRISIEAHIKKGG